MAKNAAEEKVSAVTISADTWAAFMRDKEGRWEFIDTVMETDDPEHVARVIVASHWRSGDHPVLVVGIEGAFEYVVKLDTEEVTADG